jgi:PilZ domain-containing protein
MERRARRRFRMKLPMTVRWTTVLGAWEVQAECEDITSRGVYFFLPAEIENGSSVELVIVMPHEITLAEPVRVRCRGRVRWTEIEDIDRVGVAVEIQRTSSCVKRRKRWLPGFKFHKRRTGP